MSKKSAPEFDLTAQELDRLCKFVSLLREIDQRINSEKKPKISKEDYARKNDEEWEARKKLLEERYRIEKALGVE